MTTTTTLSLLIEIFLGKYWCISCLLLSYDIGNISICDLRFTFSLHKTWGFRLFHSSSVQNLFSNGRRITYQIKSLHEKFKKAQNHTIIQNFIRHPMTAFCKVILELWKPGENAPTYVTVYGFSSIINTSFR